MAKYENKKILTEGWNVGSQTPIDDRTIFATLGDLINLGVDDREAYRYYEGLKAWVVASRKEYEWKESATGEIATSFTYPADISANGVTYSNREFNWVEVQGSGGAGSGNVQVDNNVSLSANVPLTISITGATSISNIEIYDSSTNRITGGLNIKVSSNTVTLESNITIINLTVKTTF